MNRLDNEIEMIQKGCGNNLDAVKDFVGEKRIYWRCGEASSYNFDLCSECKIKLSQVKRDKELIEDFFDSLERTQIFTCHKCGSKFSKVYKLEDHVWCAVCQEYIETGPREELVCVKKEDWEEFIGKHLL